MSKQLNDTDRIDEFFLTFKKGEIHSKVIADTEKMLIEKALRYSSGNQIAAAKILGLNRNTLRAKIKKLNVNVGEFKL